MIDSLIYLLYIRFLGVKLWFCRSFFSFYKREIGQLSAVFSILFIFPGSVYGQQPISKDEIESRVKSANISLKILEHAVQESQADFKQSSAFFLPNFSISHTGTLTTNPLMAFGSKLNQEILRQADFKPELLNDPEKTQNFATKISLQQPLFNLDGFYQRKAAALKVEAAKFQKQRRQEYLLFEAEKTYMQLQLAYKAVFVLKKALAAAEANHKIAKNNFEEGYLQRAEVLEVEIYVAELKNKLQTAKSNIQNVSNYLSLLMNETQETVYYPSDSLRLERFDILKDTSISDHRTDLKAMSLASGAYKALHEADNASFLPRLNAFGRYEFYDDKIFNAHAGGYLLGVQLHWTIFEGGKRFAKRQKSKIAYEKSALEYEAHKAKSVWELQGAKRKLADAEAQLKLTQLVLKQAEEALRIRKNRFEEGLEKAADLLKVEAKYAEKQMDYYRTIYQYNYTKIYLEFLTQE